MIPMIMVVIIVIVVMVVGDEYAAAQANRESSKDHDYRKSSHA